MRLHVVDRQERLLQKSEPLPDVAERAFRELLARERPDQGIVTEEELLRVESKSVDDDEPDFNPIGYLGEYQLIARGSLMRDALIRALRKRLELPIHRGERLLFR